MLYDHRALEVKYLVFSILITAALDALARGVTILSI
jgi:hypothetical protein